MDDNGFDNPSWLAQSLLLKDFHGEAIVGYWQLVLPNWAFRGLSFGYALPRGFFSMRVNDDRLRIGAALRGMKASCLAFAFAALLLCLHPLALQIHLALTERQHAACCCGSCSEGASGHDAKHCAACEILGLLAASQVEPDGSTGSAPAPVAAQFSALKPFPLSIPCSFKGALAQSRAPPASGSFA